MTDRNASTYHELNHLVQKKTFDNLVTRLGVKAGDDCLDIGCGTGNLTSSLINVVGKNGSVLGIDPDEHRIAKAKQQYGGLSNISLSYASNLSGISKCFDVAIANHVTHWMTDKVKMETFQVVFQMLKPGGVFGVFSLLSVSENVKQIYRYVPDNGNARKLMNCEYSSLKNYKKIFITCGFEIIYATESNEFDCFDSLETYLRWMNASAGGDVEDIYMQHKDDILFEKSSDGKYKHPAHSVCIIGKKPLQAKQKSR
ncbi:demethylmenaquinone methyltransferase-like [Hydractinia symbiolongicarpus]|uniref:demethylmenaquinone methyltransferase-like n=1 Tax=Hydractinia symbiolongicarpus TaxID=13093 RepID=UPI00255139CE|nr:demethylmenaquinone methyltransferase-like [Hydractinia symbiolongicarpus]